MRFIPVTSIGLCLVLAASVTMAKDKKPAKEDGPASDDGGVPEAGYPRRTSQAVRNLGR